MTRPDEPESGQPLERLASSASRFLTARCVECQRKFGYKAKAIGKELACPKCGKRQIVGEDGPPSGNESTEREPSVDHEQETTDASPRAAEKRRVKDKSAMKHLLASLAGSVSKAERQRLRALLPPRYAAAGIGADSNSDQQTPRDAESLSDAAASPQRPPRDQGQFAVLADLEKTPVRVPRSLQIDIESSAVDYKGSRVPVKAVSRNAKEFRRRLRVGVVFGFSALVLIALFWFLINRVASGS